jgi:hypothetical protein
MEPLWCLFGFLSTCTVNTQRKTYNPYTISAMMYLLFSKTIYNFPLHLKIPKVRAFGANFWGCR